MAPRFWIVCGAVWAALGVGLGAFGAHGLEDYFQEHPEDQEIYRTADRYQMYHALGVILAGLVASVSAGSRWALWSGGLLLVGNLIFSGCLYAIVLTDIRILGAIVPIGGTAMIVGWLTLAVAGWHVIGPNQQTEATEDS